MAGKLQERQRIGTLATRQHGVVARQQLYALGLTRHQIDRLVAAGFLHRIYRGVYAVGHKRLTWLGRWMAAVLAGGEDAVLSHRSAGAAWEICTIGGIPEVTLPRMRRSREAVVFHWAPLPRDEITSRHGIPATTPARTLLDLSAVLTRHELDRALNEADYRRHIPAFIGLLRRYPGRAGTKLAWELLEDGLKGVTREELEAAFALFIEQFGLPRPERNVPLELPTGRIVADCMWREQRVIVELDSRQAHQTTSRFESDRVRDRQLQILGWQVVRVTWRELHRNPQRLARDLMTLLGVDA